MIQFRKMEVKDIDIIVEYEISIFNHSLGHDMLYQELTTNPFARYYVALDNDKIIGYIGMWNTGNLGQILNFLIIPSYQGKGIGNTLLAYGLEALIKSGVDSISLEVRPSNSKAINLYKSKGFRETMIRHHYYPDGEDALLMIKEA